MVGLIRHHKGQWITGFHRDMKATSSAMVELWALRDGLNLTLAKISNNWLSNQMLWLCLSQKN